MGAENDWHPGQRRGQRQAKCNHSAAVCVCGHCIVYRDEESLQRSEWHKKSFLWAWACVFVTPTPQKMKVGVVC